MRERPILFAEPMVRAILDDTKTQTRLVVNPQPVRPAADCHPQHKAKHKAPYLDAYCNKEKTEENPRGMSNNWCWWQVDDRQCLPTFRCPYGEPGNRLWVRESWRTENARYDDLAGSALDHYTPLIYEADGQWVDNHSVGRYRHARFMPRWASRITLEVTGVRVERLQNISECDAVAEGCAGGHGVIPGYAYASTPIEHFRWIWESINPAEIPLIDSDGKKIGMQKNPAAWESNPWVWVIEFKKVQS